jgi:pimeloyl-ACP methyl ester carboxylesterase
MTHEAHLPQGTIRYRDEGTGDPLLFIHGLG